ncbi:uncharacterized protein LOC111595261 [Drosophila hydei]|uniref:Uncharacterized protein LOC111595261 n=1 Tax=Drosophila hydei TaxID=7224 RepID=A0A6J1LEQ5_DROHY|nr:uncharacterized protein LOC111595261 [Drosophila hydei]
MIPSAESIDSAQAGFESPINMGVWCEESRCNQLQTAADVYRRTVERIQRETTDCQDNSSAAKAYEEILKQIWIATFTGGNIYYRA